MRKKKFLTTIEPTESDEESCGSNSVGSESPTTIGRALQTLKQEIPSCMWNYMIFWQSVDTTNNLNNRVFRLIDGCLTTRSFLDLNSDSDESENAKIPRGCLDVSIIQEFKTGGLACHALRIKTPVWIAGLDSSDHSLREIAKQGLSKGMQTTVGIPIPQLNGVVELGSKRIVYIDPNLIERVRCLFKHVVETNSRKKLKGDSGSSTNLNERNYEESDDTCCTDIKDTDKISGGSDSSECNSEEFRERVRFVEFSSSSSDTKPWSKSFTGINWVI